MCLACYISDVVQPVLLPTSVVTLPTVTSTVSPTDPSTSSPTPTPSTSSPTLTVPQSIGLQAQVYSLPPFSVIPAPNPTPPVITSSLPSAITSATSAEFKPIFPPSTLSATTPAGFPTAGRSAPGGFVFKPSKPAAQTSDSGPPSLFQSRPGSSAGAVPPISFSAQTTASVSPSASSAGVASSASTAPNFTANCVSTAAATWLSAPAYAAVSSESVFPRISVPNSFGSGLPPSAGPVQNSFSFQPGTNAATDLFRPVSSSAPSFLSPPSQANGQSFQFAGRPDVIGTVPLATAAQTPFVFGQSAPPSTAFPNAGVGTSQPPAFSLFTTSANSVTASPPFAFGSQSSGAANMFGTATTQSEPHNSLPAAFGNANPNNAAAPAFGFQSPVVPSTFNFGKFCHVFSLLCAPIFKILEL